MKKHRYNMGIVGNCSYLAYIDTDARVQWMCLPRFDSSFIFGSLLDPDKGGEFSISPAGKYTSHQYYLNNSNVLCTEFHTERGKFRVVDCAPRFQLFERTFRPLMLIRKIEHIEGDPAVKVCCRPVGDYGKVQAEVVTGSNHIRYTHLGARVRLTTDISLTNVSSQQPFILDQDRYLAFTYGEPLEASLADTSEEFIMKTGRYWRNWIKSTYLPDIYQKEMIRSALVLKLHQYEDTGGIIASGTMGLPEHHGSARTWDYRYCWFRDTYYTLKAFNEIGHFHELEKYFEYIQNTLMNVEGRIQPLYTLDGDGDGHTLREVHLDLKGYLGNQPVRIGNGAYTQIQNDVYGQVLVSLLPLFIDKRLSFSKKQSYKSLIPRLLDWIEKTMEEPDAGLWEFRNVKQVHTYTMLFHWAGSKAAVKIGQMMNDGELAARAARLAKRAGAQIEKCYRQDLKHYSQAIGSDNYDASTLKLITMGYLDPASPIAKDHLEQLEKKLKTDQGLFYRYVHADDFGKPEATFLVCAFWYVDALACVGRIDDAIRTLDGIIQYANHLGIFSEDVGLDGSQWGNFPQTYSHVGMINAAFRISKKLDRPNYK